MSPTVVIGIGNPFLCDDTAGLHAIARLRKAYTGDAVLIERYSGGMELFDDLAGRDRAIIIDSIRDPAIPPGTMAEISWEDMGRTGLGRISTSHGINLPTVIELGRKCGFSMPREFTVIAIGGENFTSFSESVTSPVETGIDHSVAFCLKLLYDSRQSY